MRERENDIRPRLSSCAIFPLCLLVSGLLANAGIPLPQVTYYGQACDGYGWPYRNDAQVVLFHGTNEVTRHFIDGSVAPGVNFMLRVSLDDGRDDAPYTRNALEQGDAVTIRVYDQYGQHTIIETNLPTVGLPGDLYQILVTAGVDQDGDGLSDRLEYELIDSGIDPSLQTLEDVTGSDDADGDGASNAHEFHAGTFAFLDYDYFHAHAFEHTENDRLCITFLSVPGKGYRLEGCTDLVEAEWQPATFALSDTDEATLSVVEGTGDWVEVFVPRQPIHTRFLRITTE